MITATRKLEDKKFFLNANINDYLDEISVLKRVALNYENIANDYLKKYNEWASKKDEINKEIEALQDRIGNAQDEIFSINKEIIDILTPRKMAQIDVPFPEVEELVTY